MAAPIMNAGSDVVLAYAVLGPVNQALTGAATVTLPGTAMASWLWELVEKPSGSSAALSSTSAQNPTLNGIDVVGTYRLFLQGTDNAAQSAESDKLLAPSSAFVTVSVTTQYAALHKPSPGQRDWHDEYWALIDVVDALKNTTDTHIADTADPHQTLANTATVSVSNDPTAGEVLQATGPAAAQWTTAAAATPVSAVGTLGKIECAETPFSAPNPKAVTRDKVSFEIKVPGTLKAAGFSPWEIDEPGSVLGVAGASDPSVYHATFAVPWNFYLDDVIFMMEDGGSAGSGYTFSVYNVSSAQFLANTSTANIGTINIGHTSGAPLYYVLSIGASIAANQIIGVIVKPTSALLTPGGGLTVQAHGYQEF